MNIVQAVQFSSGGKQSDKSGFAIKEVTENDLDVIRDLHQAVGLQVRSRSYDRWRFFYRSVRYQNNGDGFAFTPDFLASTKWVLGQD